LSIALSLFSKAPSTIPSVLPQSKIAKKTMYTFIYQNPLYVF